MSAAQPSRRPPKAWGRPWPPVAHQQGIDIPVATLVAIVLGVFAVTWFSWSTFAGDDPFVVGWQHEPSPTSILRQLILPNLAELVVWLLIVTWLGWRRAVGLVRGSASAWGVVPLVSLWVVTLLTAGLTDVVSKGAFTVLLAAVGYFVAALNEEIVYRGFLLHGFTRRFGGTAGVLLSSATFALIHLPTLLQQHEPYLVGTLLFLFGDAVALCRIRVATGSIWLPTAIHTLHNLTFTGIVVWAFPEGQAPAAYGLLLSASSTVGFILAIGLFLRWFIPRAMERLVSTTPAHPEGNPPYQPAPAWWMTEVGPRTIELFTTAARRVMVQAEHEARADQDRSIGTEHILLGLLHQTDGLAARALEISGLSVGPRERLDEPLVADEAPSQPPLPWHARTKLVVRLAIREADERDEDQVAPEHLLLALTAIRAGEASRALRSSGVEPAQLRRTLARLMMEANWKAAASDGGEIGRVDAPAGPRGRPAGIPFEHFPEQIRSYLENANAEARAAGSSALGTRHLLSALCREPGGTAARSLEDAGYAHVLDSATPVDATVAADGALALTPRAKKALDAALHHAVAMDAAHVGPEHVLLALIDEHQGEAAQLLVDAGVDPDRLREIAIGRMT